jgi:hypothetical protein
MRRRLRSFVIVGYECTQVIVYCCSFAFISFWKFTTHPSDRKWKQRKCPVIILVAHTVIPQLWRVSLSLSLVQSSSRQGAFTRVAEALIGANGELSITDSQRVCSSMNNSPLAGKESREKRNCYGTPVDQATHCGTRRDQIYAFLLR